MSRLTIAAGLFFLLCVTGLAQEGQERERDNPDRPREKVRGARDRDTQDRRRSKLPGEKRVERMNQRVQELRLQLAGAKKQVDDPGEVEKLQEEIDRLTEEIVKLRASRRDRRAKTDWEAEYQNFLKENPGVKRAIENGRIAKEKVLAEIKDRAAEKAREAGEQDEQSLEREFQQLIKERPDLARQIKAGELEKEAVMQRLRIGRQRRRGQARDNQERPAARRGRVATPAQVAFRSKLGELVRAGKLTRADAGELYQIAFPENTRQNERRGGRGWSRLKENDADGDGKISKDEAPENIKRFFDRMDRNKDGFIEESEVGGRGRDREGAGARGRDRENFPARDREGARDRAGDRSGERPRRERRLPSREELIKRFDKDGDGKLNDDESRAALRALRDSR
ncbi:MAG: hypothetical protein VX346_12135 [Planctomycetota bacterium]|nr:hypothetical protein [Planctomycetota bacterium]